MRLSLRRRRNDQTGVPTMRLYTLTGTTQVKDNNTGVVHEADANGAFELPEDLGLELHSFHVNGKRAWEDDAERAKRMADEQLEKMRDPATLLAEIQKMSQNQGALAAVLADALGANVPSVATSAPTSSTPVPAAEVAKRSPRARRTASPPAAE